MTVFIFNGSSFFIFKGHPTVTDSEVGPGAGLFQVRRTEPNEITCPQDAREGKVSDRFLAPEISRFATSVLTDDEQVEDLTQPVNEAKRQLESLHQRWSKITKTPGSENVRMKAYKEAEKSSKFIRIVQRRDLSWEKDSIARAANDPEHIPDCNVQATVDT